MDENLSRVLGEIFADLWYIPEMIICLTTYLFTCCSMQKQLSMMTPRLRTDKLGAMNSSPTRTYSRFGLFRNLELMTTSSVLSWLSFNRFLHIQSSISSTQRSSRNFALSRSAQQSVLKEKYSCGSSAYRWYSKSCYLIISAIGAVWTRNSRGPSVNPWGTPRNNGRFDDMPSSTLTNCWREG